MRAARFFAPVLLLLAVAPAGTAQARPADYDAVLVPSPDKVRPGQTITVAGDFCPTPNTVTFVGVQTLPKDYPKGLPPHLPLDLNAIDLQQTATGMSFEYIAPTQYTVLHFAVTCSDGSHAIDTGPVMVFPPLGQFWWSDRGGEIRAQQGIQFTLAMTTMDCDLGQQASVIIYDTTTLDSWFSASGSFSADGVVYWDITPSTAVAPGAYLAVIHCAKPGGGTYMGTHAVLVADADGNIPATGSGTALPIFAATLLAAGTILLATSRQRRHRAG